MARKFGQQKLQDAIERLTSKYTPDDILHEMSVAFEEFSINASSEAEVEFWLKTSKACANLSSGTEKWRDEMVEEQEEEE